MYRKILNFILLVALVTSLGVSASHLLAGQPRAYAQDDIKLPQFVVSADQRISLRLPEEWTVLDASETANGIAFGSTELGAQQRLDDLNGNPPPSVSDIGGVVVLLSLAEFNIPEVTPQLLEQVMQGGLTQIESIGGKTLEKALYIDFFGDLLAQQAVLSYNTEVGLFTAVGFEEYVALITVTAGAGSVFDETTRPLFEAITKSVRVPAEAEDGGLGQKIRNEANTVQFSVPEGWVSQVDPFTEGGGNGLRFYLAVDEAELGVISSSGAPQAPAAVAFLLDFPASAMTIDELFTQFDIGTNFTLVGDAQTATINGYEAKWLEFETGPSTFPTHGYWVVFNFGDQAMLFALRTNPNDWENSGALLESLFKAVLYDPNGLPEEIEADLGQTLVTPDGKMEITVPTGWSSAIVPYSDASLTGTSVFFGIDDAELENARASGAPQAPAGLALLLNFNGTGQTIEQLFNLIGPTDALARVNTGMETINGYEAMWAEFEGTASSFPTHGYWVVYNFGEQVLMFVMRTNPADWENSQATFEAIFRSVKYNP